MLFSEISLTDNGTLKLMFWFLAKGDSTAAPVAGTKEEVEDFDPVWVDVESAVQTLTFGDDKQIAEGVIELYVLPLLYLSFVRANLKHIDSEPTLYPIPLQCNLYLRALSYPVRLRV